VTNLCSADALVAELRANGFTVQNGRAEIPITGAKGLPLEVFQSWALNILDLQARLDGTSAGWTLYLYAKRPSNERSVIGPPASASVADIVGFVQEHFVLGPWRTLFTWLRGPRLA
jgi:hypothetical protein